MYVDVDIDVDVDTRHFVSKESGVKCIYCLSVNIFTNSVYHKD